MKNHFIGITAGDPKGIGPEVVTKALAQLPAPLRDRCRIFGDLSLKTNNLSDIDAARAALTALDDAIAAIKAGEIAALVTAPVNKARLQQLVPDFTGHTGYLAKAFGVKDVVMMFVLSRATVFPPQSKLREGIPLPQPFGRFPYPSTASETPWLAVSLATVHIPLADVSRSLTSKKILSTIQITTKEMRDLFGIALPKIAVLGLNPHAGENGALGREEIETIIPAIHEARKLGITCDGPFPADSFFVPRDSSPEPALSEVEGAQNDKYDAVIAMYHDQGLIPAKLLGHGHVVNMTLGLPFVRTDPAHGTAEDIVGKGIADPSGMLAAIKLILNLHDGKHERTP